MIQTRSERRPPIGRRPHHTTTNITTTKHTSRTNTNKNTNNNNTITIKPIRKPHHQIDPSRNYTVNSTPIDTFRRKLHSIPMDSWHLRTQQFESLVTSLPKKHDQSTTKTTQPKPGKGSTSKTVIPWYESTNTLRKLGVPVSVLLLDARSTVVKHTCEQLVFLVKRITIWSITRLATPTTSTPTPPPNNPNNTSGLAIESHANNTNNSNNTNNPCRLLLKDLLPTILLLHAQTINVKRTYAADMMKLLIPTCPFRVGIPILLERMRNDKSADVRQICVTYLIDMLRYWTNTATAVVLGVSQSEHKEYITPNLRLKIGKGVVGALGDASEVVRGEAKVARDRFRKSFPEVWRLIMETAKGDGVYGSGRMGGGIRTTKRLHHTNTNNNNSSNKTNQRRSDMDEGYTSDGDLSYDSIKPVVGFESQYTLESIRITSGWNNNSIQNNTMEEHEQQQQPPDITTAAAWEEVEGSVLHQYQQQVVPQPQHDDDDDDDDGGGSDIYEGIFHTTDDDTDDDGDDDDDSNDDDDDALILTSTTSTASTAMENRTAAISTIHPTTTTTNANDNYLPIRKSTTPIYNPFNRASSITTAKTTKTTKTTKKVGARPVSTINTAITSNGNHLKYPVILKTKTAISPLTVASTANDNYSHIRNPVTITKKKEDSKTTISALTAGIANGNYSPISNSVITTINEDSPIVNHATLLSRTTKEEGARPVTSIFTANISNGNVSPILDTVTTTKTKTKEDDARTTISSITGNNANNNYPPVSPPLTITKKKEDARTAISSITGNTANGNYSPILNPVTTTIKNKEDKRTSISQTSASNRNDNCSPILNSPITTIHEDGSNTDVSKITTTTTTNTNLNYPPSLTPKKSLNSRTTDRPKPTTTSFGGDLAADVNTTDTTTTGDNDNLIVAEELDSAHKMYINELMAKLRLEMDAMKDFNCVITRAKEGGDSNASSEGYNRVDIPTSANGDSQGTEMTEDEVLLYFETIYNFLDKVDDNNMKLRTAMYRIGNANDSNGDSRPYSRDRTTATAAATVLPAKLSTTMTTTSATDNLVTPMQSTIDEVDEEETQNSDSRFIEHNGSLSPLPLKQQGRPNSTPFTTAPATTIIDWVNQRFWEANEKNDRIVKDYWVSGMTELNLTNTELCGGSICSNGKTNVDILAKLLRDDTNLTKLYLGSNKIGDHGCQTIMEALKSNSTLRILDLRDNGIGDRACHSIMEALSANDIINELCLMSNIIGNRGFQVLVEGLVYNSSITDLNVLHNDDIDSDDLVRHCISLIERNGVMKRHRKKVASIGIAHYIKLEEGRGGGDGWRQLQWAQSVDDGGNTHIHIQEAATSGDGWALIHFFEALRSIINNSSGDCKPTLANDPLLVAIQNKTKLKRLLNTRIDDSYVLHLFVQAQHKCTLELCKFLVYKCGADFDSLTCARGRTAQLIASASSDPGKLKWATGFGTLFGRYKLVKNTVVYRSPTCLICEAIDILNMKCNENKIALKILYDHDEFMLEYYNYTGSIFKDEDEVTDESITHRFDEKYVIKLLRVHYVDIQEVDPNTQKLLPTEQLRKCTKFRVLVMPMAMCTVADIISKEQMAYREICDILHGIASAMKHIHDKQLVHSDAKPENFVRMKSGEIKAIDFDAMVPIGGKFKNKNCRGVCTPERAKLLFYSESDHLQQVNYLTREMERVFKALNEDNTIMDKVRLRELKKTYRRLDTERDQLEELEEDTEKITRVEANFTHDVWMFGMIMFELLAAKPLFHCHTNGDLANREKQRLLSWKCLELDDLQLVMQFNGTSDGCAINLLQKCLQGNPTKRYQSMVEILQDPFFSGFKK